MNGAIIGSSTLGELTSRRHLNRKTPAILSASDADVLQNGPAEIELIDRIIISAVKVWRVALQDIFRPSKRRDACLPRYAIALVARKAGYHDREIALALVQDRSTIFNSLQNANEFSMRYPRFRENVAAMQADLGL